MKFYKRFPGDITIKTGDLSLTEFGAYDRLLDHYYAKEKPIEPERVYTVARCQTAADRRAVDRVLSEFWTRTPAGWVQERADEMIADALPRIEAAKANGKLGGRPKGSKKKPTGLFPETHSVPDEKASQSQSYSVPSGTDGPAVSGPPPPPPPPPPDPPTDRELLFANGVALLTAAGVMEKHARSMLAGLAKAHGDAAVVDAIQSCADERAVDPVTWLQRRLKSRSNGAAARPNATRADQRADTLAGLTGQPQGAAHAQHRGDAIDVHARVVHPHSTGAQGLGGAGVLAAGGADGREGG